MFVCVLSGLLIVCIQSCRESRPRDGIGRLSLGGALSTLAERENWNTIPGKIAPLKRRCKKIWGYPFARVMADRMDRHPGSEKWRFSKVFGIKDLMEQAQGLQRESHCHSGRARGQDSGRQRGRRHGTVEVNGAQEIIS